MIRVLWPLSALLFIGFFACVSTTKPETVRRCAQAGTCSDNPRDAALLPPDAPGGSADSLEPMGTGGSPSTGGATGTAEAGAGSSTGGSGAFGGSISATGGQPGQDAAAEDTSAAGGTPGLDGGLSSGGAGGSDGSVATGGTSSSGGIRSTGGTQGKGGATSSGGAPGTGGIISTGGTTSPTAAVCEPLTAVINDFTTSGCNYGNWAYGEMASSAWAYANGASTISATCASGNWTFSGMVGATTATGANQAGFGFTLMGKVRDAATSADVSCKTFDLSAYSGFSITLSSASGAITSVGIGVNLADGSKGHTEIAVAKTAATLSVTWAQLGITSPAQITGIWGYFISGPSPVTNDLVISHFGLQ